MSKSQLFFIQSLKIKNFSKIFFFAGKNNKNLLLVKNSQTKFLMVPNDIRLRKIKKKLKIFTLKKSFKSFQIFVNNFNQIFQNLSFNLVKKIKMVGLGFKVQFSKDSKFLIFKLGFSHLKYLRIPTSFLKIFVKKNILKIEGNSKVLIGNFLAQIKRLKNFDFYKGKGFLLKYEKYKLKTIQKK